MFEQILMGPFTRLQYILSVVLTVIITGLISAFVIFLISLTVAKGVNLNLTSMLSLTGYLILGSLFFGNFGILVSLRVKSSEALAASMNLMFFLFTFLSSVFYPSHSKYIVLQVIFQINPLTYVADLVRNAMISIKGFNLLLELLALVVEGAVMTFLASRAIGKIEL